MGFLNCNSKMEDKKVWFFFLNHEKLYIFKSEKWKQEQEIASLDNFTMKTELNLLNKRLQR